MRLNGVCPHTCYPFDAKKRIGNNGAFVVMNYTNWTAQITVLISSADANRPAERCQKWWWTSSSSFIFSFIFPVDLFSSLVTLFLMYVYVFVVISVVKNSKNPIREYCDHYFSRIDRSGGWMWPELNVAIIWESKLWRWGNISLSYGACYWISDDQFSFNYD